MKTEKKHYLDQLSRKYPARVPEDYFENLTTNVMARTEAENFSVKSKFSYSRFLKPVVGIAASLVFVFTLIYLTKDKIFRDKTSFNQESNLNFDEEMLLKYHLSDQTIFEALDDSETDDRSTPDSLESELLASVSEYELIVLTQ